MFNLLAWCYSTTQIYCDLLSDNKSSIFLFDILPICIHYIRDLHASTQMKKKCGLNKIFFWVQHFYFIGTFTCRYWERDKSSIFLDIWSYRVTYDCEDNCLVARKNTKNFEDYNVTCHMSYAVWHVTCCVTHAVWHVTQQISEALNLTLNDTRLVTTQTHMLQTCHFRPYNIRTTRQQQDNHLTANSVTGNCIYNTVLLGYASRLTELID